MGRKDGKDENVIALNLRLPVDIHERLGKLALDGDRSLNSQIVRALRQWLDAHGSAPTPEGPIKLP